MLYRKKGFTKNKVEGDLKTPVGNFNLGNLYFRSDRKEATYKFKINKN